MEPSVVVFALFAPGSKTTRVLSPSFYRGRSAIGRHRSAEGRRNRDCCNSIAGLMQSCVHQGVVDHALLLVWVAPASTILLGEAMEWIATDKVLSRFYGR